MPALSKPALERYLRARFGSRARLLSYGVIGKESSKGEQKRYGYGTPVKLTFTIGARIQSAVLETMKPGPFGHEHMADRAQAMLWDYDSYGRLPRHVKALDFRPSIAARICDVAVTSTDSSTFAAIVSPAP